MKNKLLFLLSSRSGFETVAEEFVPAAGGSKAIIVLLLFRGGEKAQKYISEYTEPWIKCSIAEYQVVIPADSGKLDIKDAMARIGRASGIFIGGGETDRYRELYATEPIVELIRDRYKSGCSCCRLFCRRLDRDGKLPFIRLRKQQVGY